jgi:hypothetical protein
VSDITVLPEQQVFVSFSDDDAVEIASNSPAAFGLGVDGDSQSLAVEGDESRALALVDVGRIGIAGFERKNFTGVVGIGPRGLIGPAGPAGGSSLQRQAGETLSALLVVYEQAGQVFRLDYRDGAHIDQVLGITLSAAVSGSELNIQRSGALDDSGWNWALGRVWLGANGSLTQTPATEGNDVLIGTAVAPTRLILNIQDPIRLE